MHQKVNEQLNHQQYYSRGKETAYVRIITIINKQEKLTSCQQKLMWMKVYALNLAFMTLEIMQQLSSSQIPQLLRRAYHKVFFFFLNLLTKV